MAKPKTETKIKCPVCGGKRYTINPFGKSGYCETKEANWRSDVSVEKEPKPGTSRFWVRVEESEPKFIECWVPTANEPKPTKRKRKAK
jgi:hypothetical protein